MESKTYRVAAERLDFLRKSIEDFTKRMGRMAVRKGVQFVPPVLTVPETPVIIPGHKNEYTGEKEPDSVVYDVVLTSEPAKVPGYRFVATLEHVDGVGTIVRTVPTAGLAESELAGYRQSQPECHHCGYTRYRKDTFVVRREADGKLIQVGRNCLKDFLGHDPNWVAQLALFEIAFSEMCSEGEGGFGGGQRFYSLSDYLPWVASVIRIDGWTSRTKARELNNVRATADIAMELAFPFKDERNTAWREKHEPIEADFALAQDALKFAQEKFDNLETLSLSDYEHNLAVVTLSGAIDGRKAGIAASLLTYYNRELAKREETQKDADSKHFGTPGKREIFTLKLTRFWVRETQFGAQTIYKFKDAEGNIATWFASSSGKEPLKIGTTYKLKATVKGHEEFRGAKQTVITRAVVMETIPGDEKS